MSTTDVSIGAHSRVTITVDGRDVNGPNGQFDQLGQPEVGSSGSKYRPGGKRSRISLPALPETGDLTATRAYHRTVDGELYRWLAQRVGRARVVVVDQPTDEDLNPFGKPNVYTGQLGSVQLSDYDSDNTEQKNLVLGVNTDDEIG